MTNKIMPQVFMWMFVGLLITFLTGYYVANHAYAAAKILGGYTYLILIVVEIAIVIFLSARITKMSPTVARICFLLYSVISGLTFSSVFLVYEISSVLYVFLITSLLFGIFAIIGKVTKIDLTKFTTYLIMALVAIIICAIVNIFIGSETFAFIISIISTIVFICFIAYDVQKIQRIAEYNAMPEENLAIYGALELYLDFINLFINLLRLFGKNRN